MTYKQIQNKYRSKYGKYIKTCWIADAKRELGLTTRIAPNRFEINSVKHPCPNDTIKRRIIEIIETDIK